MEPVRLKPRPGTRLTMTTYTLTESDDGALGTIIHRDGKALLITGLSSDHPEHHNRLARFIVGVLERPDIDNAIAALEEGWNQENRA